MRPLSQKPLLVVMSAVVASFLFWFFISANRTLVEVSITEQVTTSSLVSVSGECLNSDEYANYAIKANIVSISVYSNLSKSKLSEFDIVADTQENHYHPIELHRCGIYVIKQFNYDKTTRRSTPRYRNELWLYPYSPKGQKILIFSETDNLGKYTSFFNDDFRISGNEKYLVLERSYLGKPDYALVIKDLKTMEDVYTLKFTNLIKKYSPSIAGSFGLGSWTEDGKYLLGDIYDGALETAYYRLESGTWKLDILQSPPELLAGVERAVNYNKGYLAFVDIPTFTGFQEVADQFVEEARKDGRKKNLFLYDFNSKSTAKVAETEPDKRFNIKWLSDTELQYTLPSGATSTYSLN